MRCYRCELHHELSSPLEILAVGAQEAHERAIRQDEHLAFDTRYGEILLELRSVDDD